MIRGSQVRVSQKIKDYSANFPLQKFGLFDLFAEQDNNIKEVEGNEELLSWILVGNSTITASKERMKMLQSTPTRDVAVMKKVWREPSEEMWSDQDVLTAVAVATTPLKRAIVFLVIGYALIFVEVAALVLILSVLR